MFCGLLLVACALQAGDVPTERDYYRVATFPIPEDSILEVSGIAFLEDKRPIVCTRRGQVFLIDGAYAEDPSEAKYTLFHEGLQEPMGLFVRDGWVYFTQRGELSRIRDKDGDDFAEELETICDDWRVGGNYHEYNFGPRVDADGNFWITTNRAFGSNPFGDHAWRGFALKITPEGKMIPVASGLRSPAGVEISPWGDVFYTDNQGEWCGASKLSHIEPGDFHGHPYGIDSCELPEWPYGKQPHPPDGVLMPNVKALLPNFKLPAVWFPYGKMGQSPAGMVWDESGGAFGPFDGQLFVSDQFQSSVMRVYLEEVNGHWQGACIPWANALQCGVIRVAWGPDGSLFAGQTNRGWGSVGRATEGLERIQWTGRVPFEIHEMSALPDGFDLRFTLPVDPKSAAEPASYSMKSFTYLLHEPYGSPEVETQELEITEVQVAADGMSVRIEVAGLRAGYVHELHAEGVRSAEDLPLLHDEAYYTLIERPKAD
jgi:hypothetical protein